MPGLPLGSFTDSVDDVGVPWLEAEGEGPWAGEPDGGVCPADEGAEGWSFFFDDLFESLARDSCSC
jgi:hypothetical protein